MTIQCRSLFAHFEKPSSYLVQDAARVQRIQQSRLFRQTAWRLESVDNIGIGELDESRKTA